MTEMTTNSLRVVVVFFVAASVARADLQLHETGVFADAASVNGESIFQTTSHPSSVVFQGSQLFSGGPTPPDVDTSSFFGSAVISSDASLASLISVEQKNVTSVIPGGAKRDISTGAGAQTGFSIQNASSDQVTVQVQFQSSPTLVVPTTGPSNSKAETGASVSISILDGTNVLTPISSFFGFASLDNTGSVTLSNDFAVAGVVNESDAGSTSDEHRKQLNYSGVLEATVDATSSLQVKSSTFCISNLASDGFTAPTLSYSCFDQNTFNLEISSTDPNVRFELVNVSSVPEPSAFFCLATIGAGLWIGRVTIVTWFRRPATSI